MEKMKYERDRGAFVFSSTQYTNKITEVVITAKVGFLNIKRLNLATHNKETISQIIVETLSN
jgi:hypothetical protein